MYTALLLRKQAPWGDHALFLSLVQRTQRGQCPAERGRVISVRLYLRGSEGLRPLENLSLRRQNHNSIRLCLRSIPLI